MDLGDDIPPHHPSYGAVETADLCLPPVDLEWIGDSYETMWGAQVYGAFMLDGRQYTVGQCFPVHDPSGTCIAELRRAWKEGLQNACELRLYYLPGSKEFPREKHHDNDEVMASLFPATVSLASLPAYDEFDLAHLKFTGYRLVQAVDIPVRVVAFREYCRIKAEQKRNTGHLFGLAGTEQIYFVRKKMDFQLDFDFQRQRDY